MSLLKHIRKILGQKIANQRHPSGPQARLAVEALEARLALNADLLPVLVEAPSLGSQELVMEVGTQVDNAGSTRSRRNHHAPPSNTSGTAIPA